MERAASKINQPQKDKANGPAKMVVLDQDLYLRTMVLVPGLGFVFTAEVR